MILKRATNVQLATTESKKQTKKQAEEKKNYNMEIIWRVISWEGKEGERGKRCRD